MTSVKFVNSVVSSVNSNAIFIDNSDTNYSMDSISYDTGISMRNLNRYFAKDSFVDYKPKINL